MSLMNQKRIILISIPGILIAMLLTYWLRGSFPQTIIVGCIFLFIALPTLILSKLFSRHLKLVSRFLTIIGLTASLQLFSLPLGYALNHYDKYQATKYCESMTVKLEAWKQKHGGYPEKIDNLLLADEPIPFLLQDLKFYISDTTAYILSVDYRDRLNPRFAIYSSTNNNWILSQ